MNIVRLGMIVTLGVVAYYALTIYAAMPSATVVEAPRTVQQTVTYMCPAINDGWAGSGAVVIALAALGGAITVAGVDLARRVY